MVQKGLWCADVLLSNYSLTC